MAGTQETVLKSAIRGYAPCQSRLERAKKAPTSPIAQRELREAQTARDNAWKPVQKAHDAYKESMERAGYVPKTLRDFLRDEGTSE